MALSREQVGLIFRIDADAKPAVQEMEKLKTEIGKNVKATTGIAKESFETLSSEIIESFGIDGDIANSIANQLVNVKNFAFIATTAVAGAVAGLIAGMVAAANKAAELGDKIGDLQKVTGLSAETLSGLNLAAREAGKTLDDISGPLVTFNKNLVDAQRGSKELQTVFKQLGVDFRGNTDAALRQAIERLAQMKDGAQKTAIAQKLFGDNVEDFIIVLADLEGGLDKAIDKAKELGLFFDEKAVKEAKAYKDQIKALEIQFDGLATRIGKAVIPAFTGMLGVLNETSKSINKLISGKDSIGQLILKLVALGTIALNADLLAALGGVLAEEGKDKDKKDPFKLPSIKPKKEKEDKLEELNVDKEIAQLQARLRKEELDREVTLLKLREQAREEHERRLEQLDREAAERTIDLIQREAEQRIITEEEAAQQIGAIRIASFAQRELQLKEELESARRRLQGGLDEETREELLREEQALADELEILQERRARAEEDAVNRVIEARRRDLESLIQFSEEQRRRREAQLQDQGFGGAAAGAIAGLEVLLGRTLTVRETLRAALEGIVADAQATLPKLSEVFVQSTEAIVDSVGVMIAAFVSGQSSIRQAVAAFYKAALQPLVDFLLKKAKIQFALALESLAAFDFRGFALHTAAGVALSAAAGLIGAGGSAIAGGGGGGAIAPSSGFGGGGRGDQGPRTIDQGGPLRPGPVMIIVKASPDVIVETVARDYRGNGQMRRLIRRDALGEEN